MLTEAKTEQTTIRLWSLTMGRKKEIDTSMYFCPRKDCSNYGKVGPNNQIIGGGTYGKDHRQLLKCKLCGHRFSARRGTALFDLKADEETFYGVIACLAEGNGIRATARIKKVDKDTVSAWLSTPMRKCIPSYGSMSIASMLGPGGARCLVRDPSIPSS